MTINQRPVSKVKKKSILIHECFKKTQKYILVPTNHSLQEEKKIHTKNIKGDHSKKKQKEKSLKSELRGKMKRQSFRRKEISKEIMCDGL